MRVRAARSDPYHGQPGMTLEGHSVNETHTSSDRTRIAELESLVSRLRHDLRGVITPAALIGDQLRGHPDPSVQRAGTRIGETVQRVLDKLEKTYGPVPPQGSKTPGPLLGTRSDAALPRRETG